MREYRIPSGALTALITPFTKDRKNVDLVGYAKLNEFQARQGVSGIVPVGTTGESPTLTEDEHHEVNFKALVMNSDLFVLNGCGSNCTLEAMRYVEQVVRAGGGAVLLNDPYYNGPSSLEIRMEYYAPIAKAFPNIIIVPYIIPGRTGCALFPHDLAILNRDYPNICAVKEATGDLRRMALTRYLTSPEFQIFSGDDDKTFEMMTNPAIKACGVISVISNITPAAVQEMCQAILRGDIATAECVRAKLQPLFEIATVFADRMIWNKDSRIHDVVTDKFRNPLAIKTAMNGLGMPAGPCRPPLGKMSRVGVLKVHSAVSAVWKQSPEVLRPIEEFFNVSILNQLENHELWASLSY